MRFGPLLSHFGEHASGQKIMAGVSRAEQLGFDSVWVRDHVVFDLRMSADAWEEEMEILGVDVLPHLRPA